MKNDEILFTREELKSLRVGDKVFTYFKDNTYRAIKGETTVSSIDELGIYFANGYDFPFTDEIEELDPLLAIQDTGDYVFKVFKI